MLEEKKQLESRYVYQAEALAERISRDSLKDSLPIEPSSPKEPELYTITEPKKPRKKIIFSHLLPSLVKTILLFVFWVFCCAIVIFEPSLRNIGDYMKAIICLILLVIFIIIARRKFYDKDLYYKGKYDNDLEKYNSECRIYYYKKEYNKQRYPQEYEKYLKDKEEYPNLLEKWKIEKEIYDNKLKETIDNHLLRIKNSNHQINDRLSEIDKIIESYSIPKKYYNHIDELIEIVDCQRADSPKEAYSSLESDLLLKKSIEQNEKIIEQNKKIIDDNEKNKRRKEFEEVIRRQEAFEARQKQYEIDKEREAQERKAGISQCAFCTKKSSCPYVVQDNNKGNCVAYSPR